MRLSGRIGPKRAIGVVIALVAVLAGCGSSLSGGGQRAKPGQPDPNAHFQIAYPVPQSLDPHDAPGPASAFIVTWPVYDRLIRVTPEAEYVPMLATKWTFSKDGKTLTLKLRQGVTFSDGAPFDAEAVKANLDNYKASEGTLLQTQVADISEVVVVDEHTVDLKLSKPSTTVLDALSSALGGVMISPASLEGGDLATTPVGAGAYVIDSFQPGQEVTYTRRTDEGGIWDEETGKVAKVTVRTMDADAQANAIRSGQIDLTVWSQSDEPFRSQIESGQLKRTVMDGVLTMAGLSFDKTKPPFDDRRVRQAVNYAIDREAIVDAFMPDSQARVQPWPQGLSGFDESREDIYGYDPEKAKNLLTAAGYPNGLDAGEMLAPQTGVFPQVSEVVQANLAEVGIDVKVRTMDVYALTTQWSQSPTGMGLLFMTTPSIEPYNWLQRLFASQVWVPGGATPEMARLIDSGVENPTLTPGETAELVGKAVDYATEHAFYAPLYQGTGGFVSAARVQNLDNLASVNGGIPDFRYVYLAQ